MLRSPKKLFIYFGLFIGIYIGMIFLVRGTGLDTAYRSFFCSYQMAWFNAFGDDEVEMTITPQPYALFEGSDITFTFMNKAEKAHAIRDAQARGLTNVSVKTANWGLNTWLYAVMPLLFFIALLIATPVPWKRRVITFIVGITILHLYFCMRLNLELGEQVAFSDFLSTKPVSDFSRTTWDFMHRVLNLEFNYFVGVVVWLVFTFRKKDFRGFLK
ncbi:MAG: hypothetical protein AAF502_05230 [Bacteroidota bacterium]